MKKPQKTNEVFELCLSRYLAREKSFWHVIANQFGFSSEEALRSWFRRELKRRNLMTKTEKRQVDSKVGMPNILLFDFEISDVIFTGWRTGKQYVSYDQVIEDSFLLSYSCKWVGRGEAFGKILTLKEFGRGHDKALIESFLDVFEKADICLAFNGRGFDIPVLNTRMAFWRMWPYDDKKLIDPLDTLRSRFHLNSNRLEDVLIYFGLKEKGHAGRALWKRIRTGDQSALDEMLEYNVNDSAILEDLYILLRPWMKNHPNLTVFKATEENCCPTCLSNQIRTNSKPYHTGMNEYVQYQCGECGTYFRGRKGLCTASERPYVTKQIERMP